VSAFAIRRIGPADAAALEAIAPEVFDEPVQHHRLQEYLAAPGHLMLLAVDGDLVVGQCAAVVHRHPDKPTELYIDELGTASTHRRLGIGRALLKAMFAWGRELGCEEAWLGTEPDNDPANALYRGMQPIEAEAIQFYLFRL
jgi:ribosomal protein S18 acetylase RimI-like enzyme